MSKNKKIIIACVIVSIIAFICAIVFFYQYSVCAENAQYAAEASAEHYSFYRSDPYDLYVLEIKQKADKYLIGGILSSVVCVGTAAFAFVRSKVYYLL